MTDELWTIYLLRDPRDGMIRYVGRTTKSLEHRLRTHMAQRNAIRVHGHKEAWLRELDDEGMVPEIEELCRVAGWLGNGTERDWIWRLHDEGAPLLNIYMVRGVDKM